MLGVFSPRNAPGAASNAMYAFPPDSPADSPQPSPRFHTPEHEEDAAVGVSVRRLQLGGQAEPSTAPAELGRSASHQVDADDEADGVALTHTATVASGPSSGGAAHIGSQPRLSPFQSGRQSRGAVAGDLGSTAAAHAAGSPSGRVTQPVYSDALRQQQLRRTPASSASVGGAPAAAAAAGEAAAAEVFRSSRPLFSFLQSGYGALAAEATEASSSDAAGFGAVAGAAMVDGGLQPALGSRGGFSRASAGGMNGYAGDDAAGPHSADVLLASASNTADGSGLDASAAAAISARSTLGGVRSHNSLTPTISQRPSSRCGGATFHSIASDGHIYGGVGGGGGAGGGVEPYPLPASPQMRRFLRPTCHSSDGTLADFVHSPAPPPQSTPAALPAQAAAGSASVGGGSYRLARIAAAAAGAAAVADGSAAVDSGNDSGAADAAHPPQRPQHHLNRQSLTRPAALSLPQVQLAPSDVSWPAGLSPSPPPMLQSPSAGVQRGLAAAAAGYGTPVCSSPKSRQQDAARYGGWCGSASAGVGVGGGDGVPTPSSGGGATPSATPAGGAGAAVPSPRGYGGIIFLYDGLCGEGQLGNGADAGQGDDWQGATPSLAAASAVAGSPRASYSGGGGGSRFGGGLAGTSSEKLIRLPASVLIASASNGGAGSSTGGGTSGEDVARSLSGSSGRQLLPSSSMGLPTSGPARSRLARTEQRRSRPAAPTVPSLAAAGAATVPLLGHESAPAPLLLPNVSVGAPAGAGSAAAAAAAPGSRLAVAEAVMGALQPELQPRLGQRLGG
ncbi:hypothetical protein HXX76_008350 [Chlamydomonas incerta]|uniref:Uncharacterized protein n=1 Tax=Chlamydomonas incerta TaxID=51695 RepID=A0A835SUF3_CHLIN|nr:hypothetical protein HXX76_008350 [Chlamydomonas incerta]|eukprot:KAG2433283.1 hypothetical protein HXX76_008350 [Chlamydomonas incerta]